MTSRAWLASAGWAFLCCVAGQVFITAASIALFVLFFSALVTAIFPPLLLLLGAGEGTGWHVVLFVVGVGLVVLGGSGWLMRWAYRRCRAVAFPQPATTRVQWSWARRSSILVGVVASFVFVMAVPAFFVGEMPSLPALPEDLPSTSGTV
ncbi:MAG: hypothetical protein ABI460_21180 [Caldimonas sp.]